MIGATDWVGIAAVISAVFAGAATVIGAFNGRTVRGVRDQVSTNGDPRTLGKIAQETAAANGAPPPPPDVEAQ